MRNQINDERITVTLEAVRYDVDCAEVGHINVGCANDLRLLTGWDVAEASAMPVKPAEATVLLKGPTINIFGVPPEVQTL